MNNELIAMVQRFEHLGRTAGHLLRQFNELHCLTSAAALSFTTLLAIVPLAAIGLAVLAAFPVFTDAGGLLTEFVLRNFTPDASGVIQKAFNTLVRNANNITGFGILFLILTSFMLLYEVETEFSQIWQAQEKRTLMARMTVFWTAMSLGPVIIGLGLTVSAPFFAYLPSGDGTAAQSVGLLVYLLPLALEITGFGLLYLALPNVQVRFGHAAIGGVIAALLFEMLKFGFGIYIRNFSAYNAIYGALSALPVFLIWTYLSWAVILLGGVVAAEMPNLEDTRGHS